MDRHRLQDAHAQIPVRITVAALDGFMFSGRGSTRNCGTAPNSGLEKHLGLHRGIPPRIENLTATHLNDC